MKIIRVIREFLFFLSVRQSIKLSGILEEEELMTYVVNRYDIEKEERINWIVLKNLATSMIKGEVSPSFFNWYKEACDYRIQIIRNSKKFIIPVTHK